MFYTPKQTYLYAKVCLRHSKRFLLLTIVLKMVLSKERRDIWFKRDLLELCQRRPIRTLNHISY
jgi:hypothetical protein